MKKLRVYLDTSVIGGCFDAEFQEWSNALMSDIAQQRMTPVVSVIVSQEIARAPSFVRGKYADLLRMGAEVLEPDEEAEALMAAYLPAAQLSNKHVNDMLHIAMATVSTVDVLVSWNFKHIVHLDKMRVFNSVNTRYGYRPLQILSPREVIHYE